MKSRSYYFAVKKIKQSICLIIIVGAFSSLSSCSGDEDLTLSLNGPVISVADFAATWTATRAVFTNSSNPSQQIDVVDQGGTVTFVVQANGRFTITINVPGQAAQIFSGKLGYMEEEYGSGLLVIFDGDADDDYELFTITLNNNNNDLFLGGLAEFDFENNGTEVLASISLDFVRN